MKTILIFVVVLVAISGKVSSQGASSDDRTGAPYFIIPSDHPQPETLPLKSTSSSVNISGVIADVIVKQVYRNEGLIPLEAIYVFPGSTRAAVYGMKMKIGERTVVARIEEKVRARNEYDQAKQAGQRASLLEQHRPNVFQMNVANIMPGDEIEVELKYTELLIPEDGIYEFVYPTVVGPRYSNPANDLASVSEKWVANPYLKEGELSSSLFDLVVNLDAGMPLQKVLCPSHNADIRFLDKERVKISLNPSENRGNNRDFILRYSLKGSQIHSGLILGEGKDENHFLLMVQPPQRIAAENIPPREYVFIVDISGSMHGFPLEVSKVLMKELLSQLRPVDRFNVLLFAGSSSIFSEHSSLASPDNIRNAIEFVERQRGGGGTELLPALKRALALKGTESLSRTFVIATDGYITVEKEVFDLIRENLGNANFFAFGIGTAVNRHLIEGIAHVGKGVPFIATKNEEAKSLAQRMKNYISTPVLTNIRLKFEGFDVYDVEPTEFPDIFAERPLIVYGKYQGNTSGYIEISGKTGNRDFNQRVNVADFEPQNENNALPQLYARDRIRLLNDYSSLASNASIVNEITALGLKYNLLTAYTSFVAIDSEVVNNNGAFVTVNQPLPLPQGVSGHAIGMAQIRSGLTEFGGYDQKHRLSPIEEINVVMDEDLDFNNTIGLSGFSIHPVPRFEGGEKTLQEFLTKNIIYPIKAMQEKTEGTVYIELIIDQTGSVSGITIIKGVNPLLDAEAIRVMWFTQKKWKPAMCNNKPVKSSIIVPVKFAL
jgi:Ca-activated chloride channel homolog